MAHEFSQTSRVDGVAHHAIAAARVTRVPLQDATAIAVSDIRDNNETDFHMQLVLILLYSTAKRDRGSP